MNIITFDLEEWFHILELPDRMPPAINGPLTSHTRQSLDGYLALLQAHKVTCTFFVLGAIAERNPEVVLQIHLAGHEIASHGYDHELITQLTPEKLKSDLMRSKYILEEIIGCEVSGYRGPGFSIRQHNLWAFDAIAEAGYAYDATVYPGKHGHGGLPGLPVSPFFLKTEKGSVLEEYPVTLADMLIGKTAFAGGGYFRLFPFAVISSLYKKMNEMNMPVISYFHARDFDPGVPRVRMPLHRHFKCYVNLKSTFSKLERLLKTYPCCSIRDWRRGGTILPAVQLDRNSID